MTKDPVKLAKLRDSIDVYLKKIKDTEQNSLLSALVEKHVGKQFDEKVITGAIEKSLSQNIQELQKSLLDIKPNVVIDNNSLVKKLDDILITLKKPSKQGTVDLSPLLSKFDDLQNTFKEAGVNSKIDFPDTVNIGNWPVQKIPQPVTHISINALNGYIKTTVQTLNTSLNTIPAYGVLANRRAIQIYNNSSSVTVFIGGSDVTAANGFPVPPQSFSPSFDSSAQTILYGLTLSSTAEIRVIEMSDERSGR